MCHIKFNTIINYHIRRKYKQKIIKNKLLLHDYFCYELFFKMLKSTWHFNISLSQCYYFVYWISLPNFPILIIIILTYYVIYYNWVWLCSSKLFTSFFIGFHLFSLNDAVIGCASSHTSFWYSCVTFYRIQSSALLQLWHNWLVRIIIMVSMLAWKNINICFNKLVDV